ncbi:MAG TPA: hypothetical protein VF615_07595 [Longimicrobiaceae bacterium]
MKTGSMAVYVAPEANNTSPVPVELVVAYDDELVKVLAGMTARDWFRQRAQLRQDNPRGMRTLAWEFVPGQSVPLQPLRVPRKKAKGAFVFADFYAPGDHRVRVDPFKRILLTLREDGFSVDPT